MIGVLMVYTIASRLTDRLDVGVITAISTVHDVIPPIAMTATPPDPRAGAEQMAMYEQVAFERLARNHKPRESDNRGT